MTADTAPDPVTAAVAALAEHDATCDYCATSLLGDLPCQERRFLVAARRRALRGASANHSSASGQITTEEAAR